MLKDEETVDHKFSQLKKLMEWETRGQEIPQQPMWRHSWRQFWRTPRLETIFLNCQSISIGINGILLYLETVINT
jgi:hypothetical protein